MVSPETELIEKWTEEENLPTQVENTTPEENTIPSWLQSTEEAISETPSETREVATEEVIPAWLQADNEISIAQDTLSLQETTEDVLVPDASLVPEEPASTTVVGTSDNSPSDSLPDWLVDSLRTDSSDTTSWDEKKDSKEEKPKKKVVKKTKKVVEDGGATPSSQKQDTTNIPDWLK